MPRLRPLVLLLAMGLPAVPARAQSAAASSIQVRAINATYANGSGFSLFSSGVLEYGGPLNQVPRGQVSPSLSVMLNGDDLSVGLVEAVAETLPTNTAYPRLSPQLREATTAVGPEASGGGTSAFSGALGETLPLFTAVAASELRLTLESVDGQSFSVYPRFSPSVQLPRESGLYSDPDNSDNPNAERAGPTRIETVF